MTEKAFTNEQTVLAVEADIETMKREYMAEVMPVSIAVQSNGNSPSLEQLLQCQIKANAYFNHAERFVGNSGLLGAHVNGKWVTGFAETCFAILDAYITHIVFLRSYKDLLGGNTIEPSKHAFANMQRMVKEYLPKKDAKALMSKYQLNDLPIGGFEMAAANDINKTPSWQIITSVVIGIVAIVGSVILSIFIPNPTDWQAFVFRGCLALGISAIVSIVPGFINLNFRIQGWGSYFKIVAGGAIAIFVIIWLLNPPTINQSVSKSKQDTAKVRIINP